MIPKEIKNIPNYNEVHGTQHRLQWIEVKSERLPFGNKEHPEEQKS